MLFRSTAARAANQGRTPLIGVVTASAGPHPFAEMFWTQLGPNAAARLTPVQGAGATMDEITTREEHVSFPLPKELRQNIFLANYYRT